MIPEELMEELYTLIYHTDLDGFERIERAITRISQAIADGELELPGEVGRITSDLEGPFINALKGHTYIVLGPREKK